MIISNLAVGLLYFDVNQSYLRNNTISGNRDGIVLASSNGNYIYDTKVVNNLENGTIVKRGSSNNAFNFAAFSGNGQNVVYEENSNGNVYVYPVISSEPIVINECGDLSQAGRNYILTKDLYMSESLSQRAPACLSVTVDNVILDGNGFRIRPDDPSVRGRVAVSAGGKNNVSIKNIFVRNFNISVNLSDAKNSTIQNLRTGSNLYGIVMFNGNNNKIIDSNILSNSVDGIFIAQGSNNLVVNTTFSLNGQDSIVVSGSSYNSILNSTISNQNGRYGIYLYYADRNTIRGNVVNSGNYHAIVLSNSYNNELRNNSAKSINRSGVALYTAEDNVFTDNNFVGNNALNVLSVNSNGNEFIITPNPVVNNAEPNPPQPSCCSGSSGSSGGSNQDIGGTISDVLVNDLQFISGFSKAMSTNERLRYGFGSPIAYYYVKLKSFVNNDVVLEATKSSGNPEIFTLREKGNKKVDLNADGTYDINVVYESVQALKPVISIKKISEKIVAGQIGQQGIVGNQTNQTGQSNGENGDSFRIWLIVIVLVVLAILIATGVYYWMKTNKSENVQRIFKFDKSASVSSGKTGSNLR